MAVTHTRKEIRQRTPILFVVLLAANFILMAFDAKDEAKQRKIRVWAQTLAYPFQQGTSIVGGTGLNFLQKLRGLRTAQQENDYLKQVMAEKDAELRQSQLDRSENARLKELLEIRQNSAYPTVVARVIGRDPSQWFQTITIDVGTTSGVETNMPVLAGGGLVGRVIVAGLVSSQVMLVTDDKSAAGAVIGQMSESGALGTVKGSKRDLLQVDYVPGMVTVNVGEMVLTTGQDKIYPPGLVIGTVEGLTPGTATSAHTIYVRPAARLYTLTDVVVALYKPQQRTDAATAKPAGSATPTPASGGAVRVFGTPTPTPAPGPR
jgi:rod shape-determining protein MreC